MTRCHRARRPPNLAAVGEAETAEDALCDSEFLLRCRRAGLGVCRARREFALAARGRGRDFAAASPEATFVAAATSADGSAGAAASSLTPAQFAAALGALRLRVGTWAEAEAAAGGDGGDAAEDAAASLDALCAKFAAVGPAGGAARVDWRAFLDWLVPPGAPLELRVLTPAGALTLRVDARATVARVRQLVARRLFWERRRASWRSRASAPGTGGGCASSSDLTGAALCRVARPLRFSRADDAARARAAKQHGAVGRMSSKAEAVDAAARSAEPMAEDEIALPVYAALRAGELLVWQEAPRSRGGT